MEVVVTGIGMISALGNLCQSWNHLISSKCGIRLYQPFPELSPRPLGLIKNKPAQLTALTRKVVAEALQDANLKPPLPEIGVVIGSSRSYQGQWEQLARQYWQEKSIQGKNASNSPFPLLSDWLQTLPNMAAIIAARLVGTAGPVLAPMAACATGIWAIAQGFELIRARQCDRVVAGAVEAPITPLTLAGFAKMGVLAKTGAYPFDQHREGLVLGEGGAVFVLEEASLARRRGARVYGRILGFGLTNDACYATSPNLQEESALAAVKHCCQRSGISLSKVDYIHAHGTSTQLNDECEAQLIQRLFPAGVPVSSTKGATGHTLGASGALGVAFCLMALQHQVLPPCVGLREPAFALDFVREARQFLVEKVLCLSFGFGGQNASIALGR
ncbi:MAG TPA: beta-ketoacyl-ACP synthase [Oscillatoriaceae cyanobacterium M7585_C2015_266]|nr:beta-ketoacyl-ACP synthase [Oscillatoriaceae cyanobacterium M7585_C2015_266]